MCGTVESVLPSGRPCRPVEVSIVLPCFNSQRTLAGFLDALRGQTFSRFEVVTVDSSPGPECQAIVRDRYPEVRYERVPERLLPHAARNRGVELARGDLLVFTDPDVYADPLWLETLVASHRRTGRITAGAIACHGRRWIDVGAHLCKFSTWLPGGSLRPVDNAPTVNLLCPRGVFLEIGPFSGDRLLGDTEFSWQARRCGHVINLEPRAIVVHDHDMSFPRLLEERYRRGVLFGQLRADWYKNRRLRHAVYLLVSILPIRLTRILALTAARCWRAGLLRDFVWSAPVVALGQAASLAGECRTYAKRLVGVSAISEG